MRESLFDRDTNCPFCNLETSQVEQGVELALVFSDRYPVHLGIGS
jgi:hypothetical protein